MDPIPLRRKEVKDIAQGSCFRLVEFGVAALLAADGGEFLVLYVKDFRETAAHGADLVDFVVIVTAARTLPMVGLHACFPSEIELVYLLLRGSKAFIVENRRNSENTTM